MMKYICICSVFVSFGVCADNKDADSKSNHYGSGAYSSVNSIFATETRPPNIPVIQVKSEPVFKSSVSPECQTIEMVIAGKIYRFANPLCEKR